MTKRASGNHAPISKGINKIAAGFTIIETMLFLAIAGLIFAGLVAGTNGAIRQQRYKDSVQGFVDDLRDLYSLAENSQVLKYEGTAVCSLEGKDAVTMGEGRGRSSCSVYGIYAKILPSESGGDNVEAYWVTGVDQALVTGATNEKDFFEKARVSTITTTKSPDSMTNLTAKKHSVLWGADIAVPCVTIGTKIGSFADDGCIAGSTFGNKQYATALFIYRSPITGSINTLTYLAQADGAEWAAMGVSLFGQSLYQYINEFDHEDVAFCVTTGAGMSKGTGLRMVQIDGNGSNSTAVRLIEADSEENECND